VVYARRVRPGPFAIDDVVTATAYPAAAPIATYVFAHGAGAGQKHVYMKQTAERLASRGVSVVTFDFPYTARGKKVPDSGDVLEACLHAAFDAVRARTDGPLFAGGKSMGGRMASQAAAKGFIAPAGLVFLGYPMHPPGKAAQRRDAHLPKVKAPMLFVQGTRDVFGTPEEIAPVMPKLAKGSVLLPIEGADHSHAVLKRDGVPQDQVYARIADAIVAWMARVIGREAPAGA
jgi:predicted alpha/beta-hydrolase family hydrolase